MLSLKVPRNYLDNLFYKTELVSIEWAKSDPLSFALDRSQGQSTHSGHDSEDAGTSGQSYWFLIFLWSSGSVSLFLKKKNLDDDNGPSHGA